MVSVFLAGVGTQLGACVRGYNANGTLVVKMYHVRRVPYVLAMINERFLQA